MEHAEGNTAREGCGRDCRAPRRFKWITDAPDTLAACAAHYSARDCGQQVCVLVRVDMCHVHASILQLLNLCRNLLLNVRWLDITGTHRRGEISHGRSKRSVGREQRRRIPSLARRRAIDQHHVAAHTEGRLLARDAYRIVERRTTGHQRGAGQGACGVQLCDGTVHSHGHAEVIGIHDQSNGCAACHALQASHTRRAVLHSQRRGRVAQLVRAPALQAGCRGFESLTAHHCIPY